MHLILLLIAVANPCVMFPKWFMEINRLTEDSFFFPIGNDAQAVRLFHVAGHFGKQFIRRNADIYGKTQFGPDSVPDFLRGADNGAVRRDARRPKEGL